MCMLYSMNLHYHDPIIVIIFVESSKTIGHVHPTRLKVTSETGPSKVHYV